jgi:hypothetical protein
MTNVVSAKVPQHQREALRWLAYRNRTSVSAIVASYIARCLASEDLTGIPPSGTGT